METLKGIKIFGYGTLIPMALITQQQSKPQSHTQDDIVSDGAGSYQSTIVNTPVNMELENVLPPHTDDELNSIRNGREGDEGEEGQQYGIGSPTRISSSNDIMTLDKIHRESLRNNGNDGNPMNLLFNEGLIGQIVEKAEMGRVVMGIDDI